MSEPVSVSTLIKLLTSSEWEERLDGLRTLANVVITPSQLEPFLPLLVQALSDARSQVVREATACVVALSKAQGASFGAMLESLLPALLNLTIVTVQVMSESGDQCLKHVLRFSGADISPAAVQLLVTYGLTSKHAVLRRRCVEYVGQLLNEQSTAALERFRGDMETLLLAALGDASAPVRQGARLLWWAHKAHWVTRAQELLGRMDTRTVSLVMKDEGKRWADYITEGQPRVSAIKDLSVVSAPTLNVSTPSFAKKKRDGLKERSAVPSEALPSPLEQHKALRRHLSPTPKPLRIKSSLRTPSRAPAAPSLAPMKPAVPTEAEHVAPTPTLSATEQLAVAKASSPSAVASCALALLPEHAAVVALTELISHQALDAALLGAVVPAAASLCSTPPLSAPLSELFSALTASYGLSYLLPSPDAQAPSRHRLTMLRYLQALIFYSPALTVEHLTLILQCVADSNPWYKEREEGLAVFVVAYKTHRNHYEAALSLVVFDSHTGKNMQLQRLIFRLLKSLTAKEDAHEVVKESGKEREDEKGEGGKGDVREALEDDTEALRTPATAVRTPNTARRNVKTIGSMKRIEGRERSAEETTGEKTETRKAMRTPLSPKCAKTPKVYKQRACNGKENTDGQVRGSEGNKGVAMAVNGIHEPSKKETRAPMDVVLNERQREAVDVLQTTQEALTETQYEAAADVAMLWCTTSDRSLVGKGEVLLHALCLRCCERVSPRLLSRACASLALTEALLGAGFDAMRATELAHAHLRSELSRTSLAALANILAVVDETVLSLLTSSTTLSSTFALVLAHSDAMVRRDATVLLATLWRRLGADFDAQLASLQPRERKLVALYRDKQLRALVQ